MARKGWSALSPGYRARLERNGISQRDYDSGSSIKRARGHSATPERPSQAISTPSNFSTYVNERNRLVGQITSRKQSFFGTSPKWNPKRSAAQFRKDPPPMASLKRWATLTREEWMDAIREDPDAIAYLGYH